MPFYAGIDIGGTTSTVAIGAHDRNLVVVSDQFPTLASDGPEATVRNLVEQTERQLRALGGALDDLVTVGLASPGPATLDGTLMPSPNLSNDGWRHFALRAELEKAFQARAHAIGVRYIGDGQAAALGEYAVRSGVLETSSCESFEPQIPGGEPASIGSLFFLAVGTGLGGGQVRQGRVVRGTSGRAGHAGHLFLPVHAFRHQQDSQLRVGKAISVAESAVSLTALTHQLAHRLTLPRWRDHPLNQLNAPPKEKACQLRQLAAANDPLALELLDDQARALGLVALSVDYIGDHDLLIIGGGVCDMPAELRARYRQLVIDSYQQHALEGFREAVPIEFSICGDNASVIGALQWAYDERAAGGQS